MIRIDKEKCTACGLCAADCPKDCLAIKDGKPVYTEEGCLLCAHCFAVCPQNAIDVEGLDDSNVVLLKKDPGIDPEDLMYLMKTRRSVRAFTDEEISLDDLNTLLAAGNAAPSGSNLQTVRYIVFRDEKESLQRETLRVLQALADDPDSYMTPEQRKKYSSLFENMLKEFEENHRDLLFHGAPEVLLIISRDITDGSLAAANIELMAHAMGLGACYIGFAVLAARTESQKQFLELQKGEKLVACLAIGHPNVTYQRSAPKKKIRLIVK